MQLVYLGISLPNYLRNPLKENIHFCTAEELSYVKISHDEYANFLEAIKSLSYVEEVALVSTCNRFKILLHIDESGNLDSKLDEVRYLVSKLTNSQIRFNCLLGDDAKLQAYRTYCGLNSGLVGEDEICSQINTSLRQAAAMGFAGELTLKLLDDCLKLRGIIDKKVYQDYKVSYCDVAIKKSFEKFNYHYSDVQNLKKIIVLGSGSTTKKSCLALMKFGIKPGSITVIHRSSSSSVPIENLRSLPELEGINFVRSKDGYHHNKTINAVKDADLIVFGIDTKRPVLEFSKNEEAKIIDFNSNPSCTFEPGFNYKNYVSNLEADSFVRSFAGAQVENPEFSERLKVAENILKAEVMASTSKSQELVVS